MYTDKNFKSKKEFKTAVEDYLAVQAYIAKYGDDGGPYKKREVKMTVDGKPCKKRDISDHCGTYMHMTKTIPPAIRIFQPGGLFTTAEAAADFTGTAYCEGPHYPEPHRWYAEVKVENGIVIKVK